MKILILAAMDKELSLLLNLFENPIEEQHGEIKNWTGNVGAHQVFLAKCGIGKVNSALNTFRLIQILQPDLILNSGVAGGAGLPIGTVLVADKISYSDVWCGPGTLYGQVDGFPLYFTPYTNVLEITKGMNVSHGLICSSDKFISSEEEISFIRNKFPEVKAVDMESAAIAQTCMNCQKPFAIIRVVSDTPGEGENISQYKDFWETAPEKTFSVLSEILKKLKD